MRRPLPALLAAALPLAAPPAAVAQATSPSFDCSKAAALAEQLVCRTPDLARRDRDLAALYTRALAVSPDAAALRSNQRQALGQRAACTDAACVESWYTVRRAVMGRAIAWRLKVGACEQTRVESVGTRLQGVPGSGSFVSYANALTQVSYDGVPGIDGSRAGDPVRLCVRSRPRQCPAGDRRGSVYAARNLRTGARWTAGDSEHACGGA